MSRSPLFPLRTTLVARVGAIALVTASLSAAAATDVLYRNGTIITLDATNRLVEAVFVRDDRIVAVGSEREVRSHAGPPAAIVDLRGATMVPGFYAAHDHLPSASISALYDVDLNSPPIGSVGSIDDILAALRTRAASTLPGKWITGRGYDDTLVREKRHPTRYDLDRVSTEHPIWITHTSGHLGVANSRALAIAKITRDTPNPANGVIQRDANSPEPNGVFEECGWLVSRYLPRPSVDQRVEALRQANRHYLAKGVTTSVIAGGSATSVSDLKLAVERRLIDVRVVSMLSGGGNLTTAAVAAIDTGRERDRLRVGAVKLSQDGSLQGYTGFLTVPYHQLPPGKEGYRGYAARSRDDLVKLVTRYHNAGLQVAIHGNGDAAIEDILFAFAEAQRLYPRADARHRIEHCQTPREDQLERMRELGVSPSFFVGHVFYWGDRHRDIFLGPERAARISPLRSALNHGLRFSVHNDSPVTPVDPLLLVWAAVNRTTRETKTLGSSQRIGVIEALRAVTSDAAWQCFDEQRKGSIEPGKLADFVILAENPLAIPTERLRDVVILETIVGGRSVYRR
ncbi:MAG: amidohydrolase [Opitutaceae bacterium]|nr:amidohydrolase [Opitutaceae bacterium]